MFDEPDSCVDFLRNVQDQKVFLILSAALGETLMPLMHDLPQLDSIYILCDNNKIEHKQWLQEWNKIKGAFNDISFISDKLKQNMRQCEQNLTPISIVSTSPATNLNETPSAINLNELDPSFMYTKLLKEILITMEQDEYAKSKFTEFCRANINEINTTLEAIDEFDRDFDRHSPIWWYTKDTFIYSILNRALRTQNTEMILKMGFFVRNLHRQIEQIHLDASLTTKMTIYRGQGILNTEFEKMKKSEGGLLSFNNFLSTTDNKEISHAFADSARQNSDLTGILFQLEIDPSIASTPFASVENIGYFSNSEHEILFSMHTVFRIGQMQQIDDRLWEVKLTSTSDNDEKLNRITELMREDIVGPTGLHRLGQLMINMGELDKAEEFYETQLKSTSDDDFEELAHLYHQLGTVKDSKGDCTSALTCYEKTLELKQKILPIDHLEFAYTYNNIGGVHELLGDYQTALSYYEKALEIEQKNLSSDDFSIASTHGNIGVIHHAMGKYSIALSYYKKGLEIYQKSLPPYHPKLAIPYNNIGRVHDSMGDYRTARSFYEKGLEIQQKTLPTYHPELATTYSNLGMVHDLMGDYPMALSYYKKAIEIYQKSFPANHPSLANTYNDIGQVYKSMDDYSTALSYYKQALEIYQTTFSSDHPSIANIYNNIGVVYRLMEDYQTSLVYYAKTLEIYQKIFPSDHPSIANIYNNIGRVHVSMEDYSNALLYAEKTLEIEGKCFAPNHPSLAVTHCNIARALEGLMRYHEAGEHAERSVDILCQTFDTSHPKVQINQKYLDQLRKKL